jgi:hypothetical protein
MFIASEIRPSGRAKLRRSNKKGRFPLTPLAIDYYLSFAQYNYLNLYMFITFILYWTRINAASRMMGNYHVRF